MTVVAEHHGAAEELPIRGRVVVVDFELVH